MYPGKRINWYTIFGKQIMNVNECFLNIYKAVDVAIALVIYFTKSIIEELGCSTMGKYVLIIQEENIF
jgi:hypothetical protein